MVQVGQGVLHGEIAPVAGLWRGSGKIAIFHKDEVGIKELGQLLGIAFLERIVAAVALRDQHGRPVEAHMTDNNPLLKCPHRGVVGVDPLADVHQIFMVILAALELLNL